MTARTAVGRLVAEIMVQRRALHHVAAIRLTQDVVLRGCPSTVPCAEPGWLEITLHPDDWREILNSRYAVDFLGATYDRFMDLKVIE